MKICPLEKLVDKNFNTVFINALEQFWHTTRSFQCIGAPKKQNLLLYLNGCRITYTCKDGRTVTANSGDVVYVPMGSEYRAQLSNFRETNSHTVGINFFLLDEDARPLVLSEDITVFHLPEDGVLYLLFRKAAQQSDTLPLLHSRLMLLQILNRLTFYKAKTTPPAQIAPALAYLSAHLEESPSVAQLATFCNISEVYFRKQFKKNMGITPVEYRNSLRLKKAQSYLEYGDISVQEISAVLGYATVSHFIKEFKQHTGCSPLQYRKSIHHK